MGSMMWERDRANRARQLRGWLCFPEFANPVLYLLCFGVSPARNEKMNMKYFTLMMGAALALAGCVVDTTTGGVGGNGGSGNEGGGGNTATGGTGGGTSSSGGGGTGGTSSTGGTGGTGGTADCTTCADFYTNGGADPCTDNGTPSSAEIYDALVACVCEGACKDVCADNVCTAGGEITTECQDCVADQAAGCGKENSECSNDAG
jgi:hypothetical protein